MTSATELILIDTNETTKTNCKKRKETQKKEALRAKL